MGIIRKTVSIGTLGIVPFRSKRELLKRAEKDRRSAEAELHREHLARAEADRRIAAAEKRMQKAELTALHEAKVAAKAKRRHRRGRKGRAERARAAIEDLVAAAQPVVEQQAKVAGRRARKAAKASRHAAEQARKEARKGRRRARAKLLEVERAVAPHVDAASVRAHDIKEELVDKSTAAAERLKERAEAVRG